MPLTQFLDKQFNWRRLQKILQLRQFSLVKCDGYAIAEFAIVLPALVAIGIGLLAILSIGAEQISLKAKCVEVTRIIARGDSMPDVLAIDPKYEIKVEHANGLVAVQMEKSKEFSVLTFHYKLRLKANASALDESAIS